MSHSHHTEKVSLPRLLFTVLLNLVITIAQIIGGLLSGSLALISDAIHNLSDTVSILLAYIAQLLSQKPVTPKSTFGYKRAEILAAFINALSLIGISVYLVFEAVERFGNPKQVDPSQMFWFGVLGLLANSFSVLILERDKNKSINIKAAYLHLLGDALTSLAVVTGALLIWWYDFIWADPVITILISIYLFVQTIKLLKESVSILMQMAPSNLDIEEIKKQLIQLEKVADIHHIHVWKLTDKLIHFECHANVNKDLKISETNELFISIKNLLHDEFDIEHVTVQFEYKPKYSQSCGC